MGSGGLWGRCGEMDGNGLREVCEDSILGMGNGINKDLAMGKFDNCMGLWVEYWK